MPLFELSKPHHTYPLVQGEVESMRFRTIIPPEDWVEGGFYLTDGYTVPGYYSFEGREWQKEVIAAPLKYRDITISASTQVGKSTIIEALWTWFQKFIGGRSLLAYQDKETAEDVFRERLSKGIKANLPELWSGHEDDLKKDKMLLRNGIASCGSCNVEATFSTFGQDWVFADELAKWKPRFDATGMARGRFEDYLGLPGPHARFIKSSSPKNTGDPLHSEVYRAGVLRLVYKRPCPRCRHYHLLEDYNIHEIPNADGVCDHDPVRILMDNAAEYKCPKCTGVIGDDERYIMSKQGVWATQEEEIDDNGGLINPDPLRGRTQNVAYITINRLLSTPDKYPFARALSSFFTAKSATDPRAWDIYQNEDAARWIDHIKNRLSTSYLEHKAKKSGYRQYGDRDLVIIPDGVIAVTVGIDTQDAGVYYVARGWGRGMETWLLRHDYIYADMHTDRYRLDPKQLGVEIYNSLGVLRFQKKKGTRLHILKGFIDEGGHRKREVGYACQQIPWLYAYKGSSRKDAEMIERSLKQDHYNGNTRTLSVMFDGFLESKLFHLPEDVGQDYLQQVKNQYNEDVVSRTGVKSVERVKVSPDHYRDAENYDLGAAHVLNLHTNLSTDEGSKRVERISIKEKENPTTKKQRKKQSPFRGRRNLDYSKYRR